MTPHLLPAVSPRKNRLKTRRLLASAARAPIVADSQEMFGRLKRLEVLGYLRRAPGGRGWVATDLPYRSPQAARDDEMTFDFEGHRRRFEWVQ
jgi:hypothetical protein